MGRDHAPASYRDQTAWTRIQEFLPASMRLGDGFAPAEEAWDWRGHAAHLDRFANARSPVKLILLHGVGTNGRQMSLIVGGPLARRGFETVAVDLPGYGVTRVRAGAVVSYADWVELVSDLIDAELARDGRPVVLYGLSAGGMLAYHAAALNGKVAGIVGMTFLDQRVQRVRDATAHDWLMSRLGAPLAAALAPTPLGRLKIPMRLASKMHALVNDRQALKAFLGDRSSAGNWVSLRFLHSYLNHAPGVEPEDFAVCPILLTQPEQDAWTPLALSELFLRRLARVKVTTVLLGNAGHYPLERPGLQQLEDAIAAFIGGLTA